MTNGRNNLNRGGGGGAASGSGGKRRYFPYQPNRSSRRYRDSPHPMNRPLVQRNQPPPPPTHARRRGGAWSTSVAPPPQPGNGGSIQVRGGCGRAFRAFWFSISLNLWARLFVSLDYSLGN